MLSRHGENVASGLAGIMVFANLIIHVGTLVFFAWVIIKVMKYFGIV